MFKALKDLNAAAPFGAPLVSLLETLPNLGIRTDSSLGVIHSILTTKGMCTKDNLTVILHLTNNRTRYSPEHLLVNIFNDPAVCTPEKYTEEEQQVIEILFNLVVEDCTRQLLNNAAGVARIAATCATTSYSLAEFGWAKPHLEMLRHKALIPPNNKHTCQPDYILRWLDRARIKLAEYYATHKLGEKRIPNPIKDIIVTTMTLVAFTHVFQFQHDPRWDNICMTSRMAALKQLLELESGKPLPHISYNSATDNIMQAYFHCTPGAMLFCPYRSAIELQDEEELPRYVQGINTLLSSEQKYLTQCMLLQFFVQVISATWSRQGDPQRLKKLTELALEHNLVTMCDQTEPEYNGPWTQSALSKNFLAELDHEMSHPVDGVDDRANRSYHMKWYELLVCLRLPTNK